MGKSFRGPPRMGRVPVATPFRPLPETPRNPPGLVPTLTSSRTLGQGGCAGPRITLGSLNLDTPQTRLGGRTVGPTWASSPHGPQRGGRKVSLPSPEGPELSHTRWPPGHPFPERGPLPRDLSRVHPLTGSAWGGIASAAGCAFPASLAGTGVPPLPNPGCLPGLNGTVPITAE